ncbi:hypothetical protein ACSVHO_17740 [Acinetobacter nosocomialis]|uniref:hypothetical protein n=1 Tax=Acinetobacter nosocomialis TaxID=106654 RepID=UPI003F61AC08
MKKIIFGTFVSVMLTGCVAPSYNATSKITEMTSRPNIGEVVTVGVGEQMLYQGNASEDEVLDIANPIKVNLYSLPAGQYAKTGSNEKGDYFSPITKTGALVGKSFFADPVQVLMVSKENKLCVVTVFNASSCSKDAEFKLKKVTSLRDNTFQQTLIYSGKIGNKINVGYREFSGSLARPAFNNDVEYDLSESKEIGYKGALLQIIDANNQNIKYKVIRNFNKVD